MIVMQKLKIQRRTKVTALLNICHFFKLKIKQNKTERENI